MQFLGEPFDLQAATYFFVRFGRSGEQLALYVAHVGGDITVRKFRRNSACWIGPVRIHLSEVLRPASQREIDRATRQHDRAHPAMRAARRAELS